MSLAEQIAREHIPVSGAWECSCSEWKSPYTDQLTAVLRRDHRAHIATVTERAVRERIAAQIEVLMRRHDAAQVGFSAVGDAYANAARIARGESDG